MSKRRERNTNGLADVEFALKEVDRQEKAARRREWLENNKKFKIKGGDKMSGDNKAPTPEETKEKEKEIDPASFDGDDNEETANSIGG